MTAAFEFHPPGPLMTVAKALALLLGHVSYLDGACRTTDRVGDVLPEEVIRVCRATLGNSVREPLGDTADYADSQDATTVVTSRQPGSVGVDLRPRQQSASAGGLSEFDPIGKDDLKLYGVNLRQRWCSDQGFTHGNPKPANVVQQIGDREGHYTNKPRMRDRAAKPLPRSA